MEHAADETVDGSVMHGRSSLQAAAVMVEPGTGRVLAYFGNHRGDGADFAGYRVAMTDALRAMGIRPPHFPEPGRTGRKDPAFSVP